MKYENILIIGFGISGKSAAKSLNDIGKNIFVYDDNIKSIDDIPNEFKNTNIKFLLNSSDVISQEFDLIMKSPGINPENKLIKELKNQNKKIISDIELGYLFKKDQKIIAITGTNGKTTTTTLINEILNKSGITSSVVGNIGVGAVSEFINNDSEYLVMECSSFQLDDIDCFKSDISIITNITTDHLDYHITNENYKNAKMNILKNLKENDFAILNIDDENLKDINGEFKIISVSALEEVENGFFYKEGFIYGSFDGEVKKVLNCSDINIKGIHNYYNIMYGLGVFKILNLDIEKTAPFIYDFQGVKHRLQFVKEINNIKYYNDSKGTNSDSTIKAISSFNEPIVIILGGYDKKEDFSELYEFGKDKIKSIIALGQTKNYIYELGKKYGYEDIHLVENLKEGFELSKGITKPGDILLLSPACASWDMYKSYEERGEEFISLVEELEK